MPTENVVQFIAYCNYLPRCKSNTIECINQHNVALKSFYWWRKISSIWGQAHKKLALICCLQYKNKKPKRSSLDIESHSAKTILKLWKLSVTLMASFISNRSKTTGENQLPFHSSGHDYADALDYLRMSRPVFLDSYCLSHGRLSTNVNEHY